MALYALAQCTARLLLAHHQKQGLQRAGINSRDAEEEGMREDLSIYFALAELGMEERVREGWCVCVLAPSRFYAHAFALFLFSRLNRVEPDRATWQAAHRAFTQAFLTPEDTVQQKKLVKLMKRPLPKEVADALFTYEGFLHGLGCMSLST